MEFAGDKVASVGSKSSNTKGRVRVGKLEKRLEKRKGKVKRKGKFRKNLMIPPQLRNRRGNVSTEDLSEFNTSKTSRAFGKETKDV